jgi:DNA-binding response OmpR family regulator
MTVKVAASKGAKILIIEDEPMIALDLEDVLTSAGFLVVGVATRLDKALALIEQTPFDVAILDANLNGLSSDSVAASLTAQNRAFVVLSGYSLKQKQAMFPGAHFIQKPCKPDQLIATLNAILSARTA